MITVSYSKMEIRYKRVNKVGISLSQALGVLVGILRFDSVLCGVRENYQTATIAFLETEFSIPFFLLHVKTDFLEDEGHLQFVVIFYNICLESTSYCYWKTN